MLKSKFTACTFVAVLAFALGVGINNIALSDPASTGAKIAVVDVNKVVANSAQVKTLKQQQDAKKAELQKWLDTVKADVNKQSTDDGKKKLAKKYDQDFQKKQQAFKEDYAKKLETIDKSISGVIATAAQAKGFDVVLSKSSVLYGGTDLTNDIIKAVK